MKRLISIVVLFCIIFTSLYAKGKKDTDELEMDSFQSWEKSIDISAKKKGKYNILITAKDIAGNEGAYGPFNMYIDPKSDLPVTNISSPMDESRIVGNVNVVGTCVDDDAVDFVEIRIDDSESVYRAKGKEFWSYYIDTSKLEEGVHTIEAWGVDKNGVKGIPVKSSFNLDRRQPLTSVLSKATGELVSGNITLSGTIEDGNGIERFLYSLDDGKTFEESKISYNKKTNLYSFKVGINTKEIEDGPKVCWFKAIDKQGSVGIYTFLFFVDNTPPQVKFVYPVNTEDETSEVVGSVFSIAGTAFDTVGLESLSWQCGKDAGEFEITPGNNYWLKELDLTKDSGKSSTILITAKDLAGNVVKEKVVIPIDKAKDKPILELASPKEGDEIGSDLFISGFSYDKTGVNEIRYTIDRGEEKVLESEFGGFGVLESQMSSGEHTLSVCSVNNKGVKGDPVIVKFKAGGMPPTILFDNNDTVIPFYNSKSKISANISIKSSSGLQEVLVGYNGEELLPVQIKSGVTHHIIKPQVNSKSTPGIYTIDVSATDLQGRTTAQKLVVQVVDVNGSSGEENFVWATGNRLNGSIALMLDGKPISGIYQPKSGAAIESVEVIGGDNFTTEIEGNLIKLFSNSDGSYKIALKIIDTSGEEFTSPELSIFSDVSVPKIELDGIGAAPSFVKNYIDLKGTVKDGSGIKSVEYTLGDGFEPKNLRSSFSEKIDISNESDGHLILTIKATDKAGREAVAHKIFYKDTEAPTVEMVQPLAGDAVNGSILASFKIEEKFSGVKVEYRSSSKKKEWEEIEYNSLPHKIIGTAEEPISKNMQFRFTDIAGNSRIYNNYNFAIDNSVDIPTVELHLPAENQVIFKDFEISGMVYDDDAPAKIYYKIDDGEYTGIDIKNSFGFPVSLDSLTDNEHTITVYAEDIYGVKSAPVKRKIRVSLNFPKAEVTGPSISETVNGVVAIKGTASDKNGIKLVEISVDNGNTFNEARGTENWEFLLNTHIVDDGTHVIFVRATDKYGQKSVYSTLMNIDNTPPVLKFEYPLQGSKLDKTLFISGQTYDNISLEGVSLSIKSLDGKFVPKELAKIKLEQELLVSKDIDISILQEGKYNLEVRGIDKAENTTEISVNFSVYRRTDKNRVELLYPLSGKTVRGEFNVYGRVISDVKAENAVLYVDGEAIASSEISKTNYVSFRVNSELITEGPHKLEIRASLDGNRSLISNSNDIEYSATGPWITIDNFAMGDFAIARPYLRGDAGYTISEAEQEHANSKEATTEERIAIKAKKLEKIEISFDNGKTFEELKYRKGWKYRIETGFMKEGNHFLLVRAVMQNKEVATCRTIIKVDKTLPNITLITPGEGGKYNEAINFVGLASDDIELAGVTAALRKGDKSSYGVPAFIQGLHFEAGFWGASLWNVGFGLSFFENNVKVQFHYGQFSQSQYDAIYGKKFGNTPLRYGGHIVSFKLLANVAQLPFGYYFGPDWNWLYLTASLGAQFSLFTKTQSGKPQVLSALLTQIEFPRVKLHHRKNFSSFSFFTEGQLWFIPTDVNSGEATQKSKKIKSIIPHLSCGIRLDVF